MLQFALDLLEKIGLWGLFTATAIEASSLPFPGAVFILIYGYLIPASPFKIMIIAVLNSFVYVSFSLIPYLIGYRLEGFTKRWLDSEKVEKAQEKFRKYGEWSIALSRPTGFGNYISYLSGISKVKLWHFILFSFIGVLPWNLLLLFIGSLGTLDTVQRFLDISEKFGYVIVGVIGIVVIAWWVNKREKKQRDQMYKDE
ncbi:VTT domain-containing protein [Hazenella sp. IB182357]|uniref:VTT domain-containing protein n=1 Tax=Polycladospora coralii TaxID=2771432 RepID=A0A926N7K5_9BACL|nr:VTT domain-containing protein [Polycladospora coralii]MBD1371107.1 VTT domain-containing protein [Polycladospora coralii]MBS7530049.1 VTT domain-containing protein [Polycladospora coralii]